MSLSEPNLLYYVRSRKTFVAEISSNEDLIAFIWTTPQGSTSCQDYIDFIR